MLGEELNKVLDGMEQKNPQSIDWYSVVDLDATNQKLQDNINNLITCQICLERFQSAGERIPCKLKCPHIMCKKCSEDWLKMVSFSWDILTI